jgi:hypothetical protein
MWRFNLRFFMMMGMGTLTACAPLLTPDAQGTQAQLAGVWVATIPDAMGQYARFRLMRALKSEESTQHAYRLYITLNNEKRLLAPSPQGLASRYRLQTKASYRLQDQKGKTLAEKTLTASGSYNVMEAHPFSVSTAEKMTERSNIDTLTVSLYLDLATLFYKEAQAKARAARVNSEKSSLLTTS